MMDEDTGDDEHLDSTEDCAAVGAKVLEMADRVKAVVAAMPSAQATWFFEVDDVRFKVVLTVATARSPE